MNKRIKYIIIAILVIVGIVLFYKNVYIVKTTYKTLSPKVANLDIKVFGIGNVSAKDIYSITAQTGGKIISILTDEGQWVKKGDLLITIDPVDIPELVEEMLISVEKTKSELKALIKESESLNTQKELALITYKRYEKLVKQSFVSRSEFDKAKTDLNAANILCRENTVSKEVIMFHLEQAFEKLIKSVIWYDLI